MHWGDCLRSLRRVLAEDDARPSRTLFCQEARAELADIFEALLGPLLTDERVSLYAGECILPALLGLTERPTLAREAVRHAVHLLSHAANSQRASEEGSSQLWEAVLIELSIQTSTKPLAERQALVRLLEMATASAVESKASTLLKRLHRQSVSKPDP